jgi:hypothetical protein
MTSGIIEILIENSAVQSAVGQDAHDQYKIYPVQAPQSNSANDVKTPYIVVAEEGMRPTLSKGCPSTLDFPRYQILVYSTDFLETETIQELCRLALDTGSDWSTDVGAEFDSIYMIDRRDLFQPAQGEGGGLYVKLGIYEASAKRPTIT